MPQGLNNTTSIICCQSIREELDEVEKEFQMSNLNFVLDKISFNCIQDGCIDNKINLDIFLEDLKNQQIRNSVLLKQKDQQIYFLNEQLQRQIIYIGIGVRRQLSKLLNINISKQKELIIQHDEISLDLDFLQEVYINDEILIFLTETLILQLLKNQIKENKNNFILLLEIQISESQNSDKNINFTQDSIGYLLFKLSTTFFSQFMLIINIEKSQIKNSNFFKAIYSQVRGNSYPNLYNQKIITDYQLKWDIVLVPLAVVWFQNLFQLIKARINFTFKKDQLDYINTIIGISLQNTNYLAGHWNNLKVEGEVFIKKLNPKEINFYQNTYHDMPPFIKSIIPRVIKLEQIENDIYLHNEYVSYQNRYNQLDIKMATIDKAKYDSLEVWRKFKVNICGNKFINKQGDIIEKQAKQYLYIPIQQTLQTLDRFFMGDKVNNEYKIQIVEQFIQSLKKVLEECKEYSLHIDQVSFLMQFDVQNHSFRFFLIDFPYTKFDKEMRQNDEGIKGMIKFIEHYKYYLLSKV